MRSSKWLLCVKIPRFIPAEAFDSTCPLLQQLVARMAVYSGPLAIGRARVLGLMVFEMADRLQMRGLGLAVE
jgi:hypothetical protein